MSSLAFGLKGSDNDLHKPGWTTNEFILAQTGYSNSKQLLNALRKSFQYVIVDNSSSLVNQKLLFQFCAQNGSVILSAFRRRLPVEGSLVIASMRINKAVIWFL